eukprot:12908361-Prorocentrum_lima.AAC.1
MRGSSIIVQRRSDRGEPMPIPHARRAGMSCPARAVRVDRWLTSVAVASCVQAGSRQPAST